MPMKWFTRDFVNGALDDDEWERRRAEYERHLHSIKPELGHGAEELVSSVNLHDAQVQDWGLDEAGVFRLRVLAGDLQRGYEEVTLLYGDAELIGAGVEDMKAWRLDASVELVWDEVDLAGDRYEHRILVTPEGDFGVRFRSLQVMRLPADPSDRR